MIIVSALSLSLGDKERLREREIDGVRLRDRESLIIVYGMVMTLDISEYKKLQLFYVHVLKIN